jgi:hypothetical protein
MFSTSLSRFTVDVVNKSASNYNLSSIHSGSTTPPPNGDFEIGVNGIGVTIIIQRGDVFCGISHAKITVAPHT